MISRTLLGAALALTSATALLADFQYQQTTKITGGMMTGMLRFAGKQAREPQVTDIYLKGNRMAHMNAHSGQVIDLDKETITDIDFDKKQYSVMTFEQMRQVMREAMAKAKEQKVEGSENAELNFKASVRETGASKAVSGYNTREFILDLLMEGTDKQGGQKGGMSMSNDMWMASDIKGYEQVRDFQLRMAQKLGTVLGGSGLNAMGMGRPDMAKGMQDMAKEMAKLKGVPVLTIVRMGSSADGKPIPAASEAPQAAQSQGPDINVKEEAGKSASNAATNTALGRLGGLGGGLGGRLGGFGKKKPAEQPQEQPREQQQQAKAAGPMILMETTTECSGFSSGAVDASKFDVPAGYKQVEPATGRRR